MAKRSTRPDRKGSYTAEQVLNASKEVAALHALFEHIAIEMDNHNLGPFTVDGYAQYEDGLGRLDAVADKLNIQLRKALRDLGLVAETPEPQGRKNGKRSKAK